MTATETRLENGTPTPGAAGGQQPAADPPAARAAENVWEAQLAIMEELAYVQKRDPKKDVKKPGERTVPYTYLDEADLIKAVRPLLLKHRVTISPVRVRVKASETFTVSGGGTWGRTKLEVRFRVRHVPSATTQDIEAAGEGADPGDKGCGKAGTYALKYAVKQWLYLETGDDPDHTPSEVMRRANAAEVSHAAARKAFLRARDAKTLGQYHKAAQSRGYTQAQLAELEALYHGCLALLQARAGGPATKAPAGAGRK
jgi:hypothetical protein